MDDIELSDLIAPIVAFLAVMVTWGQLRISRYKIKIDLFETRYNLYLDIIDVVEKRLSEIKRDSPAPVDSEVLPHFWALKRKAFFLFGPEVIKALSGLEKNLYLVSRAHIMADNDKSKLDKWQAYLDEYMNVYDVGFAKLQNAIEPYISIRKKMSWSFSALYRLTYDRHPEGLKRRGIF
jgi:hypothetical protein